MIYKKRKSVVCLASKLDQKKVIVHGVMDTFSYDEGVVPIIYDPIIDLITIVDYGVPKAAVDKAVKDCEFYGVEIRD